jgi:N6-L-threonylcarbamoyladenine synthase
VPEIASRRHCENISAVVEKALSDAGKTYGDIDAVAVTFAPGLIGALLVGVNFAKGLALSLGVPLIPVHHLRSHIAANYIAHTDLTPPFICLCVSGGTTLIVDVQDYTRMEIMGGTMDDAAGECFDKTARVLGLGYPGGAPLDKLAKGGNDTAYRFPRSHVTDHPLDMSFSGLKTAVINLIPNAEQKGEKIIAQDVCASFQTAVVNELATKAIKATIDSGLGKLVVAGGVSANSFLKARLEKDCKQNGIELFMPELKLCTDNAAMIGSEAYYYFTSGGKVADLGQTAKSVLPLEINIDKK